MVLFGFQVGDSAKPGVQDGAEHQGVSSESFIGEHLPGQMWGRTLPQYWSFAFKCNPSLTLFSLFWSCFLLAWWWQFSALLFCLVSVLQEQASKLGVPTATLAAKNAVANVERICQDSAGPSRVPLLNSDQRVRGKLYLCFINKTALLGLTLSPVYLLWWSPKHEWTVIHRGVWFACRSTSTYKKRSLGLSLNSLHHLTL